jgi:type IV pilus assembly protein PilA
MYNKSNGYSLVELIVTIAILGIIAAIAIPRLTGFKSKAEESVCAAGGMIRYEGGIVKCSVHEDENEDDENESPGDEVPWL